MCKTCFDRDFKSFESDDDWEDFKKILIRKHFDDNGFSQVKFVPTDPQNKAKGYHLYECSSCGAKWKLRKQTHEQSGYFVRKDSEGLLKEGVFNSLMVVIFLLTFALFFLVVAYKMYHEGTYGAGLKFGEFMVDTWQRNLLYSGLMLVTGIASIGVVIRARKMKQRKKQR